MPVLKKWQLVLLISVALPFMYTERIFKPYGSESTRASTGILSVCFNSFKNSLQKEIWASEEMGARHR